MSQTYNPERVLRRNLVLKELGDEAAAAWVAARWRQVTSPMRARGRPPKRRGRRS